MERERQRERQRERDKERDTERETEREREKKREVGGRGKKERGWFRRFSFTKGISKFETFLGSFKIA